jgi:hydrogenase small subunit
MAITRRQFVTHLGTLAAAMGMSQVDIAKVVEAFGHGSVWAGSWTSKPKVVWVHGAECTGCSTSLLSLFEDVRGVAVEGTSISTLAALDLAVGGTGNGSKVLAASAGHPSGHRTLNGAGLDVDGAANSSPYIANIADVLVDFIDLQYHETVMGMGGSLAYEWLNDLRGDTALDSAPFVLVVEGAIQPADGGGYWNRTGTASWCSIGMAENGSAEHGFDAVVRDLATHQKCAAIIPIGQCACFGGYPACVSPVLGAGQTGAMGTYEFLTTKCGLPGQAAAGKVVNVPGCPTNPWWFVLTVVAWLVDFVSTSSVGSTGPLGIIKRVSAIGADPQNVIGIQLVPSAVDRQHRLKKVYALPLHGPFCTRAAARDANQFATQPGDPGCLQLIGCKGPQTMTLCGVHGWNGQQPRNDATYDYGVGATNSGKGGNCVAAGHPCMACTEQGYPDAFLPFITR